MVCVELELIHGGGGYGWEVKLMGMTSRDGDDGEEGLGLAHHDLGILHVQQLKPGRLREGDRALGTSMA